MKRTLWTALLVLVITPSPVNAPPATDMYYVVRTMYYHDFRSSSPNKIEDCEIHRSFVEANIPPLDEYTAQTICLAVGNSKGEI